MHRPTLAFYDANARRFFEGTSNVDMGALYEPFLSLIPEGGRILDAGCGSGRDSRFFLDGGYEVTAFDASEAMVNLASRHIGHSVLRLSFDEIEFEARFDGVWACASLLHVPKKDMFEILRRLVCSLRAEGILYASFKHGDGERLRDGRLFNDYGIESFGGLLRRYPELEVVRLWQTADLRSGREEETWFNALLKKH